MHLDLYASPSAAQKHDVRDDDLQRGAICEVTTILPKGLGPI
jgi:hypothetical protein